MYAPKLYDLEVGRDTIQEFKGYNHNLRIGDNEFYDMKNLTGKYYPLLSPRAKRGVVSRDEKGIYGIIGKDKLVTIGKDIHGDVYLWYNGKPMFMLGNSYNERQLISMGAYVIVYPDMKYFNTADTTDYGSCFGEDYSYPSDNVSTFQLFGEDGAVISANNMMWGQEYFSRETLYIDPASSEDYPLFGIPPALTYKHGIYSVTYSIEKEYNYENGWAEYMSGGQSYAIYQIAATTTGYKYKYVEPSSGTVGAARQAHLELMKTAGKDASLSLGYIRVTATITSGEKTMTSSRFIDVCAKYDGERFIRSSIEKGDRRMWFNDGATKSQICVRTEDTPEATYNTPSCWRDEATRVRVTVDTDFTEMLRNTINEKEGHLLRIPSAEVNGKPFAGAPLLEKYGDDKSLAINSMTVVSGTEVDILGFLDFFDSETPQSGSIGIDVTAMKPFFDYMIESNNRLWACRYGEDYKGDFVNAIYASAYGSFRTFFKFDGGDADSYQETVGSSGAFTGAATLSGKPVFFKENCCHTIYGTYPSTFQLSTEQGTWVASGSHKSIAVDESVLYFHGKDGIYAYDGASKQMISSALGKERYKNAVGGCVDGKYYVSMQNAKGESGQFVFDKSNGMWHKEDSTEARFLAPYNGDLYMVDSSNRLITLNGSEGVLEGDVEWYAESGKIGFVNPDNMYIGKIQLKLSLPLSSSIKIYVQYDSDGYWEFKGSVEGKSTASFTVPIMPRSCDHFAIRLSGVGDCKIFSMTKTYESGGEV